MQRVTSDTVTSNKTGASQKTPAPANLPPFSQSGAEIATFDPTYGTLLVPELLAAIGDHTLHWMFGV
jgi:hypothetical protein